MIIREQIGHTAYRVTRHDGIEITLAEDYRDPAEAQARWVELQRGVVEELASEYPPPLPGAPSTVIVLEDLGEHPPFEEVER